MQGVAGRFVEILGEEQRSALKRVVVSLFVAVALAGLAYVLYPWQGVVVHAGALVLGLLVGHLAAGNRTAAFEASLKGAWGQWMRLAVTCESVAEIHRRVRGRTGRNLPYLYAAGLTLLAALELALLVIAFQDTTSAALALPAVGLNGLLAGGLVGFHLRHRSWTREFKDSVKDLVESGEIGVWGVV